MPDPEIEPANSRTRGLTRYQQPYMTTHTHKYNAQTHQRANDKMNRYGLSMTLYEINDRVVEPCFSHCESFVPITACDKFRTKLSNTYRVKFHTVCKRILSINRIIPFLLIYSNAFVRPLKNQLRRANMFMLRINTISLGL